MVKVFCHFSHFIYKSISSNSYSLFPTLLCPLRAQHRFFRVVFVLRSFNCLPTSVHFVYVHRSSWYLPSLRTIYFCSCTRWIWFVKIFCQFRIDGTKSTLHNVRVRGKCARRGCTPHSIHLCERRARLSVISNDVRRKAKSMLELKLIFSPFSFH